MAEELENLTLRLLQELRTEMREMRSELNDRCSDIDERLEGLTLRVDGNTVMFSMLGGLVHRHEERLDKIEARLPK